MNNEQIKSITGDEIKLKGAIFEFEIQIDEERARRATIYSAHWSLNDGYYDTERKFEVAIYRGGGYYVSFYTDNRICTKNSIEFIQAFFKTDEGKKQIQEL